MTTIVFDGRTLAADRLYRTGMVADKSPGKLHCVTVLPHPSVPKPGTWWIGFAGQVSFIQAAIRALESGADFPSLALHDGEGDPYNFALAVQHRGPIFTLSTTGEWMRVTRKRWAVGSGWEIALGAMEAGASARRAVQIVSSLAPGDSGFGVQAVDIR